MADDNDDDKNKPQPQLALVAKPPATIIADPQVVDVQVVQSKTKPPMEKGIMSVRNYNTVTVISGGLSGFFAATVFGILVFPVLGWIPLWAVEAIARLWPIWVLVYLLFEVVPLRLALSMSEVGFKVDKFTSWAPLAITIIMMIIFIVEPPVVSDLWLVAIESLLASIIDLMLMFAVLRVRQKAEVLIVEARKEEPPKKAA